MVPVGRRAGAAVVITIALICGLASVWLWTVLNDDTGILKPVNRLLDKHPISRKWMECPWCSGAWFAVIPSLILFHPTFFYAVVTALAAAAIAGIVGSYIKGD